MEIIDVLIIEFVMHVAKQMFEMSFQTFVLNRFVFLTAV